MKIAILAGEASGDLLGAALIKALRARHPDLQVEGIAGPAMQAAGCKSLFDIERLSVMGFIEPLKRLSDLLRLRRDVCQYFLENRPDIFIGIDAPDFNLGIERKLRAAGIKTLHYVSPSVWAWRQYRIRKIAKSVDMMLTLLPFEAPFYEQHQVPVRYVGHPLADHIPLVPDKQAARRALGLELETTYVALLPGSRKQELRYMLEPYLLAAKQIWQQKPDVKFITAQINKARYEEVIAAWHTLAPEIPLTCFEGRSHEVLAACDAAVVTSGTATLETMLYKKPMVIAYRMSPLVYKLVRWLIKAPYAGLPNLLANEMIVPELIQQAVSAEAISAHILDYLQYPHKVVALQAKFTELHRQLQANSATAAADEVERLVSSGLQIC